MQEKQPSENIVLAAARKALKDLKMGTSFTLPVISSNDLIPRVELPFYRTILRPDYVKTFGEEKLQSYERHTALTESVRAKAQEITNAKGIPAPHSTAQLAISLCGLGECSETSNRVVLDLIRHFNSIQSNPQLSILVALGKRNDSMGRGETEYGFYNHAFVLIGNIPDEFNKHSHELSEFKKLDDECILLDPSLGIIGKANQTETLLKEMFRVYGINRLSTSYQYFFPLIHAEIVETIYQNAKQICDSIQQELNLLLTNSLNPRTENPITVSPGKIKFFDLTRNSDELFIQTFSGVYSILSIS